MLIWSKLVAKNPDASFRTRYVLLTTSQAPEGSAASFLRVRDRDEAEADKRLLHTVASSKSKHNAEAYAAYKALPNELRLSLLRAIYVLDGSPISSTCAKRLRANFIVQQYGTRSTILSNALKDGGSGRSYVP